MKSRDILTAQLGRKVTCPRPRWYFTVCWAEVTHMTSLSPEMPGRYSATLLPCFTTQIRKLLHLLGFRTRPVHQLYPEEVGQRGPGGFNRSFGPQNDTSTCISLFCLFLCIFQHFTAGAIFILHIYYFYYYPCIDNCIMQTCDRSSFMWLLFIENQPNKNMCLTTTCNIHCIIS